MESVLKECILRKHSSQHMIAYHSGARLPHVRPLAGRAGRAGRAGMARRAGRQAWQARQAGQARQVGQDEHAVQTMQTLKRNVVSHRFFFCFITTRSIGWPSRPGRAGRAGRAGSSDDANVKKNLLLAN